jgi:hypothetical protein
MKRPTEKVLHLIGIVKELGVDKKNIELLCGFSMGQDNDKPIWKMVEI